MAETVLRSLRSIRLAIILILILTAVSLIGIFVPLFGSVLFLVPAGLLVLNIVFCTLNRLRALAAAAKTAEPNGEEAFYRQGDGLGTVTIPEGADTAVDLAAGILRRHHYVPVRRAALSGACLAGDKNRHCVYGTLAVHLSLLLLIVGILLGRMLGFRNESFIVSENAIRAVGRQTNVSLRLKSFAAEYWDNGTPKDFRSEVVVYENDRPVQEGLIQVNHPLTYKGIRFHQGSFGPAVSLLITEIDSSRQFPNDIALSGVRMSQGAQRPEGILVFPNGENTLKLVAGAANGPDAAIADNELGLELYDKRMGLIGWTKLKLNEPQKLGNLQFTFQGKRQFSGFMVSRDPGTGFVWAAALLFLFGLAMMFYFPRRQIWLLIGAESPDRSRILIRMRARRDPGAEAELARIIVELGRLGPADGTVQLAGRQEEHAQ